IYAERAEELAEVIRLEMGKAVPEGKGEVALSSNIYRYFADNAEAFMADEPLRGPEDGTAWIRRKPVGSLLGIMPWNFPYYQVARFAAPNLVLGNTILLKQASICPVSSQYFADLLVEAGLPEGVYQNIYLDSSHAEEVLKDPRVKGFSLTGSEAAGASVAGIAAKYLKRSVLELGGNDPLVVLDSTDVPALAKKVVGIRLTNAGQVCTSP
ncbi:NAD-dependent succinate-semialdehyde dehydrogenase, partial [Burkholderia multivorans]|uniref:aldehyde dehydrogenase family protein n=1 Tax=Burkholderia multivorans TaxID=87883 RepID=UPI000DB2658D